MRAMRDDALLAALIDALPYLPGGPAIAAKLDAAKRAQLAAAMPGLKERAKTLVELLDGAALPVRGASARHRRARRAEILASGGAPASRRTCCRASHALDRLGGGGDRSGGARLRGRARRQARRSRPALARRADRPLDLAGHIRRPGGAGPRGKPGRIGGSGERRIRRVARLRRGPRLGPSILRGRLGGNAVRPARIAVPRAQGLSS